MKQRIDFSRIIYLLGWDRLKGGKERKLMNPPSVSDLKSLQGTSSIANFSNIVAFLVAFYFDMEHYHLASNEHRREFSISEFPFFFSIAIYCFEVRLIFKI